MVVFGSRMRCFKQGTWVIERILHHMCLVQIDVCTRTLDHLRGLSLFSRWSLAHVVLAHVSFAFFLFHCNFTCAPHSMKSCAQGMTPTDNAYLVEEINDNLAVLCIAFTLTTAVCFIAS